MDTTSIPRPKRIFKPVRTDQCFQGVGFNGRWLEQKLLDRWTLQGQRHRRVYNKVLSRSKICLMKILFHIDTL